METSASSARRILIVEDEPAIAELCRRILASEGFEVDTAIHGGIAQGLIGERRYRLCIIDIRTPVMDGKELYQWLEEKAPELARRVIFTTGDIITPETQAFLEDTGQSSLQKPFTPEELRDIVNRALNELK